MKIKDNSWILSDDENQKIRDIKAKHIHLHEYIDEVTAYMSSLGVHINMKEVPHRFGVHVKGNHEYVGWQGPISGEITHDFGDDVYVSGWSLWEGRSENIFEVETTTGNGGAKFNSFDSFIILASTLPKLEKIKFNDIEVEKIQLAFDKELTGVILDNKNVVNEYIRNSLDANKDLALLREYRDKAADLMIAIQKQISNITINAGIEAKQQNNLSFPEIKNPHLNLREYNRYKADHDAIVSDNPRIVDISAVQKMKELINTFPEEFI